MSKKEVAAEIREILKQTELSRRAGAHEAMQRFDWFTREGRKRLVRILVEIEK